MIHYSVYIVEDDQDLREMLQIHLEPKYQTQAFSTCREATEAIDQNQPDVILLDIRLGDGNGLDLLKSIKDRYPDIIVIIMTVIKDVETALSAIKMGAYDYLLKPIDLDTLEVSIQNALDKVRLKKEVQLLQEKALRENVPFFVGESNAIQDVIEFVNKIATARDTPILIQGETGTGKELIAHSVHYKSPNFQGPFISLNCSSIPRELIESELFGYERGAFTGAHASGKRGLVEEAENGTLFLDEIGDLGMEAQAKLLRFLEEGEFYRVGGTKKHKIQTRVISATNKDLSEMIDEGTFRQDLYYRLAVITVEIPSLSERKEDILPIAKHFLLAFSQKHGKEFRGFTHMAESALMEHEWQGNIRELKNMVERGVIIGKGPDLTVNDLGTETVDTGVALSDRQNDDDLFLLPEEGIDLQLLEERLIKEALDRAEGNIAKAAKLLNISYHAFRYRKKRLGETQYDKLNLN
jgi:DNA-binding NtrC family response regulator